MNKYLVLFNIENSKYWTGRFWDNPYSKDILDAKQMSEEEVVKELDFIFNERDKENEAAFEERTIWTKNEQ